MTSATTTKPALWTPGDWNAHFGFGTNILVNLLVLTGLLRFVLKMPDDGLMHGEAIGVGQSPIVAASYLAISAMLVGFAKLATVAPAPAEHEEEAHHGVPVPAE